MWSGDHAVIRVDHDRARRNRFCILNKIGRTLRNALTIMSTVRGRLGISRIIPIRLTRSTTPSSNRAASTSPATISCPTLTVGSRATRSSPATPSCLNLTVGSRATRSFRPETSCFQGIRSSPGIPSSTQGRASSSGRRGRIRARWTPAGPTSSNPAVGYSSRTARPASTPGSGSPSCYCAHYARRCLREVSRSMRFLGTSRVDYTVVSLGASLPVLTRSARDAATSLSLH